MRYLIYKLGGRIDSPNKYIESVSFLININKIEVKKDDGIKKIGSINKIMDVETYKVDAQFLTKKRTNLHFEL